MRELLRRTGRRGEIEAVMRLAAPGLTIPGVRVVAAFGDVVTCRMSAGAATRVHADPRCVSLKASRPLGPEPSAGDAGTAPPQPLPTDFRRPAGLPFTGAGVVVGVVDWDYAFAHPAFRRPGPEPATRLLALWDQRGGRSGLSPEPFGYGRRFDAARLDAALRRPDPYEDLAYSLKPGGHGTHVADILAGSAADGPSGVAPGADLVFVHLADRNTGGLNTLGDSVRILEGIAFVLGMATGACVINLSAGAISGPHNGGTLIERALDNLLRERPGTCAVQSGGNYGDRPVHVQGRVGAGRTVAVTLHTHPDDATMNEVELWYAGADTFAIRVVSPAGGRSPWTLPGRRQVIGDPDHPAGLLYHRAREPNTGDNHVDLFLQPWAPAGEWTIEAYGVRVRDGTFHGWVERDEACPHCQATFTGDLVSSRVTIGTLATSHLPVIVGACNGHRPEHPVAPFSSRGPTRDQRVKPDVVGPGQEVLAANAPEGWTRKSGTSMASPYVAGAAALCLEALPGAPATRIRELLRAAAVPVTAGPSDPCSQGAGFLDLTKLTALLRRTQEPKMTAESPDELYERFLAGAGCPAGYTVVALPGQPAAVWPAEGDRLIRVLFGWPGRGRSTALTAPPAFDRAGPPGEPHGPGYYAPVTGDGPPRRILDGHGRMPPGQLLLRPEPAAEQTGQSTPDHVTAARGAWKDLKLPTGVDIRDISQTPSRLLHKFVLSAWTNSANDVYVAKRANHSEATLFTALYHEAQHIRQFREHHVARPSSYAQMMLFEIDAYIRTAWWCQGNSDSDVRKYAEQMRKAAMEFTSEYLAGWQHRAAEKRFRDFLIGKEYLPKHTEMPDLYEPPTAKSAESAEVAPAMVIAAAGLGIATFEALKEYVFDGDFKVVSAPAYYMHQSGPTGLTVQRKTFLLPVHAVHNLLSQQEFWLEIILDYDGMNIQHVAIHEQRDRSSSLLTGNFTITLTPGPATPENEPVAAIAYEIDGVWDPVGPGEWHFRGTLVVDAAGNLQIRGFQADDRKVGLGTPIASGGGPVPIRRKGGAGHNVFFAPDSATMTEDADRELWAWRNDIDKAAPGALKVIAAGQAPFRMAGHASTTGTVEHNLRLAEQRVATVISRLRKIFGSGTQVTTVEPGELGAATADGQEAPGERRVEIEVEYEYFEL
ncbi:S8 family serine peptidase [Actinoplanes auranticolor]|nr:S8 family serine peptidase [Actinoplanes auranticolor]